MTHTINAEKFRRICDGVWRDRAAILTGRGILSDETALLRAVYWRLCSAGGALGQGLVDLGEGHMLPAYQRLVNAMLKQHAHPPFDATPFLIDLLQRVTAESPAIG